MAITDLRGRPIGPGHVPPPVIIPPYPGNGRAIGIQNAIVHQVEQQSQVVAGQNNPIRIIYGRQIVGADICGIGNHEGNLILLCVWCEGEIDAVETFWVNGQTPNEQISGLATHYTGTATQGVDSRLRLAFSSGSYTYNDAMPGIAYSVFEVRPGISAGFPQITALIRGLKVSSSFGGAKAYSTNPAYCLVDFIENTRYGMARAVDWTSVATVAAYADAMIGSPAEKRHQFSLVIDSPQAVESWLNVIRDYADCWVVPEGEGYRLVLDSTGTVGASKTISGISKAKPARITATAHGFVANAVVKITGITAGMVEANGKVGVLRIVDANHFDLAGIDSSAFTTWTAGGSATQIGASAFSFGTSHIMARSFSGGLRAVMDSPTVVEVSYTDTSAYPWRTDKTDPVFISGVYDNPPTVPFRRTSVAKAGLTRYSEANRYAIELLNSGQVDDLSVRFQAFDVALSLQAGDLIDVTHDGLDSKLMRLTSIEPVEPGRWNIAATEHDDAKYSTEVVSGPSSIDTTLDSPLDPPRVSGLVIAEVITQIATGDFVSQISATWNDLSPPAGTYPFVLHYRIDIYDGETLAETGTVQRTGSTTNPPRYLSTTLPENRLYTVRVYTISSLSVASDPAEASITNNGKTELPSDVPSISAYEVSGTVFINWEVASDLDLTGYWLRWGQTSATWETANTLDRINAIRYETDALPAGTLRIFIKALDSVRSTTYPYGQESLNAIYCDVEVTSDVNAFLAAAATYNSPLLYNMAAVPNGWVTDMGETWNSLFTATMSSYTNPIWSYHAAGISSLLSEIADATTAIAGDWLATVNYSNIIGAAVVLLELNATGGDALKIIVGASTASPASFNVTAHGYSLDEEIVQTGCSGTGSAGFNGRFWINSIIDADHYTLKNFDGSLIVGSGSTYTGNSGRASRWTWVTGRSLLVKATARYTRLRVTTTGTVLVNSPIGTTRCNVIARPDGGFFTSSSAGPVMVRFSSPFIKLKSLTVTASGSTGLIGNYDKVEVSAGRAIQSLSNALRFTASSSHYVSAPNTAANHLTQPLTLMAWFKAETISGVAQVIARMDTTAGGAEYAWGLTVRTNNTLRGVAIINSVVFNVDTPYLIIDDAWHHAALTISGTTISLYVDGILVGINTTSGSWVTPTSPLGIGAGPPASGGGVWQSFFDGVIQEVSLWNAALSQSAISASMTAPLIGNETNLVALYHLNQTSGTTATDSQSNVAANNGTLIGTVGVPSWRPLDGFDGYVQDGNATLQNGIEASWAANGV